MQRFLALTVIASVSTFLVACDRNEIDSPTSENGGYAVDPNNESTPAGGDSGGGSGGGGHSHEGDETSASFAGLHATLPEAWTAETSTSSMRAVQMSVPGPDKAAAASFVVFTGISGTVVDNVARWEGQFEPDDQGQPIKAALEVQTSGNLRITTATLNGSYTGGMNGEFAGPGVTMMQSIVEKPTGEVIFVRLLGPTETVMANCDSFAAFLDSIH